MNRKGEHVDPGGDQLHPEGTRVPHHARPSASDARAGMQVSGSGMRLSGLLPAELVSETEDSGLGPTRESFSRFRFGSLPIFGSIRRNAIVVGA